MIASRDGAAPRPGARNDLTDVPGLRVGCAEAGGSGVTVVLAEALTSAGVDVRGGGPATRETDALRAGNLVGAAHAVVLSGGSVFGLAAADGVCRALAAREIGVRIAPSAHPVPIVPAACVYDLPLWIAPTSPPDYAALGAAAASAAGSVTPQGSAGGGAGAQAGVIKGGQGVASIDLGGGLIVAALMIANTVGSVRTPCGGAYWAWPYEVDGEFGGERPDLGAPPATRPAPADSKLAARSLAIGAHTAIGVVATSADLTSAEASRVAAMAHDGLARAVRPAHTLFDGDTIFCLATGSAPTGHEDRAAAVSILGAAAGDCVARAVAKAVYHAQREVS